VVALCVSTRVTPTGSVKIAEVIEALTGDAHFPFKAVRAALTGRGGSPMDLPLYHKIPAPAAVAVAE
jgi:hypothetical protein